MMTMKPLTQRLHETYVERRFEGAVSDAGFPPPQAARSEVPEMRVTTPDTGATATLTGFTLQRLMSLKPESQELKDRVSEAIQKCSVLLMETDALVAECRDNRREAIQARHRTIRAEGKKQTKLVAKLETELGTATDYWNRTRETREHLQLVVRAHIQERNGLSQFASDEEIEAADDAVERAKSQMREAIEREGQAMTHYRTANSELANAQAKLEVIKQVEGGIRSELSGQPYFDPQFGLATTPSV